MKQSKRGIPLIYQGDAPKKGFILTVENYIKWYNIYCIDEFGDPIELHTAVKENYEKENPGHVAWSEHIPTPWFCFWLTKLGYEWDICSLETIIGRWLLEQRPLGNLIETIKDLNKG